LQGNSPPEEYQKRAARAFKSHQWTFEPREQLSSFSFSSGVQCPVSAFS